MDEAIRAHHETQSKELRVKIKTWEINFAKANQGNKPTRQDIKSNRDMAATYKEYQYLRDVLDGKKPPPPAKSDRHTADKENLKRKSPRQQQSQSQSHSHLHSHSHSQNTPSMKRSRRGDTEAETPSSRHGRRSVANSTMHMFTPRGTATSTLDIDNNTTTTPSLNRKLFSPVVPTSIGPTPHRDGRVLGLFDILPFKGAVMDSPSKPGNPSVKLSQVIQGGRKAMIQETPKKRRAETDVDTRADEVTTATTTTTTTAAATTITTQDTTIAALGHTPSSRHKRQKQTPRKVDTFATPRKPNGSNDNDISHQTPGTAKSTTAASVSKLQFLTPAFLRRIPMPKITEGSEMPSPEPIRLPRKPLLRGLSSVVADLRKLQEKELDDELDNLREIENEAAGGGGNPRKSTTAPTTTATVHEPDDLSLASPSKPARRWQQQRQEEEEHQQQHHSQEETEQDHDQELLAMLEEDAQSKEMKLLGGFDDDAKYDSPDDNNDAAAANAGLDRNGQPLRVFKKKGQKRTTRKSNMRPVRTQRPTSTNTTANTATTTNEKYSSSQPEEEDPALFLSGSEFGAFDQDNDEDEDEDGDGDELALKEGAIATKGHKTKTKSKSKSNAPSASNKTNKDKPPQNKEPKDTSTKKAPPRKVNELAHANFKRLKLRNNGAKGGPGYNSRFRRRR